MAESIYGKHKEVLPAVLKHLVSQIENYNETKRKETGEPAYEHLIYRIKSEDSMREKCQRKGLPPVPKSALYDIHDAIGIRIVCCFLNDIYDNIKFIESIPGAKVIVGKDYIKSAKPNGYRSFHMILRMDVPFEERPGTESGPVLCRNPAAHDCHGFLGKSGTSDEVQERYQESGNDRPRAEALR